MKSSCKVFILDPYKGSSIREFEKLVNEGCIILNSAPTGVDGKIVYVLDTAPKRSQPNRSEEG